MASRSVNTARRRCSHDLVRFLAQKNYPSTETADLRESRAMGTYDANREVNLEYPLAFQEAFVKVLQSSSSERQAFRYVHLGGRLTEQDQDRSLFFLSETRHLKVYKPL